VSATRTTSSANGSGAVAKAKGAGDSVASAARAAKGPALVAGATAAGLAGGLALGSRMAARRKGTLQKAVEAVARLAATTDDVRRIREQLDKANRQSPLEVVLDGLTHRRGAHKRES
jgi:hypothetical protein